MFTTANHLLNAPKLCHLMCKRERCNLKQGTPMFYTRYYRLTVSSFKHFLTNSPFHYCSLIHHPGLTESFTEGLVSGLSLTLNLSKVQEK